MRKYFLCRPKRAKLPRIFLGHIAKKKIYCIIITIKDVAPLKEYSF